MAFAGLLPGAQEHMEGNMTQSHHAVQSSDDASRSSYQVLDPRTLGRPVHLLNAFASQLREDLSELFRHNLNRRYQADFQVDGISIDATGKIAPPGRWLGYVTANGRMGCALDRTIVLSALAYRYGLISDQAAAGTGPEETPETATEERLAAMLGRLLAGALATRIESGLLALDGKISNLPDSALLGSIPAPRTACLIKATVRESIQGIEGNLYLALDDAWMAVLLRNLASTQRRRTSNTTHALPLPAQLNFKLVARLLQRDLMLGELLDLKVGDVIPVSMRAADVLIDDSRLMTATVAEHKGKLCLTSFEDAK